MQKIDLGQTIGNLANVGVVAGIVFLAIEVGQNTEATRSATIQEISRWSYDNVTLSITNADLREAIWAACNGDPTRDQNMILNNYFTGLMRIQINRFYQAQVGTIDEQTALALGGTGGPYAWPYFEQYWARSKNRFAPEFQRFVESELLPDVQATCGDILTE